MPTPFYEAIEDWAAGVITTAEADAIPPNASPRARNTALTSVAIGRASITKRRGLKTMNATAITGNPAIIAQLDYKYLSSGATVAKHLLMSDSGRLDVLNPGALTTAAADAGHAQPLASGTYYPDTAIAKGCAFICNGQASNSPSGFNGVKLRGATVEGWGITAPAAPTITASAVAGVHNGTYEGRITYYNTNTGHESSASVSSATAAPANKKIDWSWVASSDAQVTHVKLYLRNTATQPFFYFVSSVAVGATVFTSNVADTALILKGPDTAENNPPVSGIKYCQWYLSRMFIATDSTLYYSKVNLPEAFDPAFFENINTDDGNVITGLHAAHDVLFIFKRDATYYIDGDDPATWVIRTLDSKVGCVSHRSIASLDGSTYWMSEQGPVVQTGLNPPILVGLPLIGPTLDEDHVARTEVIRVVTAVDKLRERIIWAFPGLGKSRNTFCLPWNYRTKCWESDRWEMIDPASLALVDDELQNPWVYYGGYKGQVFRLWDAGNDGVPSGTMTGTITGATATTLTDSAASFVTTGAGLKERYVIAVDPAGTNVQRRRITSNTGTALTLDTGEDWSTTPGTTWTYVIGGPEFQLDTRWMNNNDPFTRKRFQFGYAFVGSVDSAVAVTIDIFCDYDATTSFKSFNLETDEIASIWDDATWDSSVFSGRAIISKRFRISRKCHAWRMRLTNRQPDEDIVVYKLAMRGEMLSDKSIR